MSSPTEAVPMERPHIPAGHEIVELRTPSPSGISFLTESPFTSSPFQSSPPGPFGTSAFVRISEIRERILEGVQEIRIEVQRINQKSSKRDNYNRAREEYRDRRDRFRWSLKTILENDIVRVWPSGPRFVRINFQLKMFLTGNKACRHDVEAVKAISQRIEAVFKDITSKDSRDMVLLLVKQARMDRQRPVVLDDNAKTVELEVENAGFDITGVNATRGQFCITLTKKKKPPQTSKRRTSIRSKRIDSMVNTKSGPVESAVSPCGSKTICRVGGLKIMGELICCSTQSKTEANVQGSTTGVLRPLERHIVDRKGKTLSKTSAAEGSQGPVSQVSGSTEPVAAEPQGDGIGSSAFRSSRSRRQSGFVARLYEPPEDGLSVNAQDTITYTSSTAPSAESESNMSSSPKLPDLIPLSPDLERFPCFETYQGKAAAQTVTPSVPQQDSGAGSQASESTQSQATETLTARQKEKLPQRGSPIEGHSRGRLPSLVFEGVANSRGKVSFARDPTSSYDHSDHESNSEPELPKLLSPIIYGGKSSKSLKEILAEIDDSNRDFQQCVSQNLKTSHSASTHGASTNLQEEMGMPFSSLRGNVVAEDAPQQSIASLATVNKSTNDASTYISRPPVIGVRTSSIGKGKAVDRSFANDTRSDSFERPLGSPLYKEVMTRVAAHDRSMDKNLAKTISTNRPAIKRSSSSNVHIKSDNTEQDGKEGSFSQITQQNPPMGILGSAMQLVANTFGIYRHSPERNVGGSTKDDMPKTSKKASSLVLSAISPIALTKQLLAIVGSGTKKGELLSSGVLPDKGSVDSPSHEVGPNTSNSEERMSKKRTRSMVDDGSPPTPNWVLVTYHGSPILNTHQVKRPRLNKPTGSRAHAAHNYILSRQFKPNGFLRNSTRAHAQLPDGPEDPFMSSGSSENTANRRSFFLKRMRKYNSNAGGRRPRQQLPEIFTQGGINANTTEEEARTSQHPTTVQTDGSEGPSTAHVGITTTSTTTHGQPIGGRRILTPKKQRATGAKFARKFMI